MPNLLLEVARGLAALWVFTFHLKAQIAGSSPHAMPLASLGHLGVPLFFVISGYCIYSASAATLRHGRSPWDFLKRRFLRIFPPFWLSILVLLALPFLIEAISAIKSGYFTQPQPAWTTLGAVDWLQIATLTRVFTAHDGDLQRVFTIFNAVYWTLAIEFQFYLVTFTVLWAPRWWKHLLVAVCVLSFIPGLPTIPGLFLSSWPLFCVGLALRWMHERGTTANRVFGARTLAIAGLLFVALLGAGLTSLYNSRMALLLNGASSGTALLGFALYAATLLWLGGGIEQELAGKAVGGAFGRWLLKPFLLLGASSYSLYLLHGKLFHLPELFVRQLLSPSNSLYTALTMAATAVLCYLFYLLCEKPFMSKRYRRRLVDELAPNSGPSPRTPASSLDVTPGAEAQRIQKVPLDS